MPDPIGKALSGLNASRRRMDAHANNLANLNTPGYQVQRPETKTGSDADSVQISEDARKQAREASQSAEDFTDVNLAEEVVGMNLEKKIISANAAVIRKADEMERGVIDLIG